jgi:hypothetical protein
VIGSLTYRLLEKSFGPRYRSSACHNTTFALAKTVSLKPASMLFYIENASSSPDLSDIEDLPVVLAFNTFDIGYSSLFGRHTH